MKYKETESIEITPANTSRSTFRELADDKFKPLPYDVDLADQRARYGEGLLRKAPEQIERQEQYEGEAAARVQEARALRAAEEEKIRAAEVSLMFAISVVLYAMRYPPVFVFE